MNDISWAIDVFVESLVATEEAAAAAADTARQTADDQAAAAEAVRNAWQSTADSILDTMRKLRGDILGDGQQGFAAAQASFAIATASARSGNQSAADQLPALANAVVELSNTVAVTGIDQALITARTLASLGGTLDALKQFGITVPSFSVGTNYVPFDTLAQVHQGEAIVPRAYNPAFNASNDDRMERSNAELIRVINRLETRLAAIERHTQNTAKATNGNPDQPMLVEVAA